MSEFQVRVAWLDPDAGTGMVSVMVLPGSDATENAATGSLTVSGSGDSAVLFAPGTWLYAKVERK